MDIISILIFFIIITIISNFIEKIKNKSENEPNSNEKFEIPTLKHKKPPIRLPNEEVKSYKTVIEEKITAEEALIWLLNSDFKSHFRQSEFSDTLPDTTFAISTKSTL